MTKYCGSPYIILFSAKPKKEKGLGSDRYKLITANPF
jgi:hypothetical protein